MSFLARSGQRVATVDLNNLATHQGFILQGDNAGDQCWSKSCPAAGDINGDGFADVLVGSAIQRHRTEMIQAVPTLIYGRAALTAPGGALDGTAGADILNGTVLADFVLWFWAAATSSTPAQATIR